MAITPINIGTVANDGTGDPLRDAFNQVNLNEADLQSERNALANKTKSATTALLTAGAQTITYGSPFADATYNLVIMAIDANGVSSAFTYTSKNAAGFTINLAFDSIVSYVAHKN